MFLKSQWTGRNAKVISSTFISCEGILLNPPMHYGCKLSSSPQYFNQWSGDIPSMFCARVTTQTVRLQTMANYACPVKSDISANLNLSVHT